MFHVCVPDKKLHLCTVNFLCKVCKFWRGEKKPKNTANVASEIFLLDLPGFTLIYELYEIYLMYLLRERERKRERERERKREWITYSTYTKAVLHIMIFLYDKYDKYKQGCE